MNHIPIQKLYWDALTFALDTKVTKLAKDIAAALGQPDAPLLKAIRDEKVSAYIFNENESDIIDISEMRCSHLIPFSETCPILIKCNGPIIWSADHAKSKSYCLEHSLCSPVDVRTPFQKEFRLFKYNDIPYFIDIDENYVYSENGELVGRYEPVEETIVFIEVIS